MPREKLQNKIGPWEETHGPVHTSFHRDRLRNLFIIDCSQGEEFRWGMLLFHNLEHLADDVRMLIGDVVSLRSIGRQVIELEF